MRFLPFWFTNTCQVVSKHFFIKQGLIFQSIWTYKFKLIIKIVEINDKGRSKFFWMICEFQLSLTNSFGNTPLNIYCYYHYYNMIVYFLGKSWYLKRRKQQIKLIKLTSHWLFSLVDVMSSCWYCSFNFENSASNLVCSSLELFRRLFKFLWSVCKTSVSFKSWLYVWFNL